MTSPSQPSPLLNPPAPVTPVRAAISRPGPAESPQLTTAQISLSQPRRAVSEEQLKAWLCSVDADYGEYASMFLKHHINNTHKLARVTQDTLVSLGMHLGDAMDIAGIIQDAATAEKAGSM